MYFLTKFRHFSIFVGHFKDSLIVLTLAYRLNFSVMVCNLEITISGSTLIPYLKCGPLCLNECDYASSCKAHLEAIYTRPN